MKPGYKTTEFYVTSFTQLVSLAVMMGFIGQDLGDTAVELVSGYVAPMVVMAVSAYAYIKSRTAVKALSLIHI